MENGKVFCVMESRMGIDTYIARIYTMISSMSRLSKEVIALGRIRLASISRGDADHIRPSRFLFLRETLTHAITSLTTAKMSYQKKFFDT
jgi:hypothetical protein